LWVIDSAEARGFLWLLCKIIEDLSLEMAFLFWQLAMDQP
jgi:hypothetical protein